MKMDKEFVKQLKMGEMISGVNHCTISNSTEVIFIIKDLDYQVKKLAKQATADVRGSLEFNDNATGFIHLVKFGASNKNIYYHWFNKKTESMELVKLLQQEKIKYFLVNEKNKVVEIIEIPNAFKVMIYKYLTAFESIWSIDDFNQLVHETMRKYKTRHNVWNYITQNL